MKFDFSPLRLMFVPSLYGAQLCEFMMVVVYRRGTPITVKLA